MKYLVYTICYLTKASKRIKDDTSNYLFICNYKNSISRIN